MPPKRPEYPDEGELILGTVDSIFKQGAFISVDEYGGKKGLLHLSEISLKWVRNIRDYVREGQKVVLLVLGVNPGRGHIDLSLRRVTDAQRKEKLQEVKQKQRGVKILELVAKDLKLSEKDLELLEDQLTGTSESFYAGLEAIASDNKVMESLNIPSEWKPNVLELINNNIKAPVVSITGYVDLRSYGESGIDDIKEVLKKIRDHDPESNIQVAYISAPTYRLKVTAKDYKAAERVLKSAAEEGIELLHKRNGIGEYHRKLPEKVEK
jgi:translation initiation factor 2 subunit 1